MADLEEQSDLPPEDDPLQDATATTGAESGWQQRLRSAISSLLASKLKTGLAAAGLVFVLGGLIWFSTRDDGPTPAEELQRALELLEVEGNTAAQQEAAAIARQLIDIDYRSRQFPGAQEFILGAASFRDAETRFGAERDRLLKLAMQYLIDADNRTLDEKYRPEWAYMLGTSLYEDGQVTRARELLEEAVATYDAGRVDAGFQLMILYFDVRTPESLQKALELNTELLQGEGLTPVQHEQVYLRRARILLALGRPDEARTTYEEYDKRFGKASGNLGIAILRGRTLMDDRRYEEAIAVLRPVAEEQILDKTFPRQASYLLGVCEMKLGRNDAAIFHFDRTEKSYPGSHEELAAGVYLAYLLHLEDRSEESLLAYQRSLSKVPDAEDYRNEWLTLDQFRKLTLEAWNTWTTEGDFASAIALSGSLHPLLPKVQALELKATAHLRWAEQARKELHQAPVSERDRRRKQVRDLWRQSGRAHAELAYALRGSPRYSDVLWTSAEHFQNGYDFQHALNQVTRFINTRPRTQLPAAYIRRGRLLMDLGRFDEAIGHFEKVLRDFPTDAAAFEAEVLIGRCHFERNHIAKAEKTWRNILRSDILRPGAREWRQAQFELGRLLFHSAAYLKNQAENPQNTDDAETKQQMKLQAYARWEEAVRLLEEYIHREENLRRKLETSAPLDEQLDRQFDQAQYLLARSLQESAGLPAEKRKTAETDTARQDLTETMRKLLLQARDEFQSLQSRLLLKKDLDRLGELGNRLLRDTYFQIAYSYYRLEDYQEAVAAYGAAVHRYPNDPQILLAYIQMANCYMQLGKPDDARGMIEQANIIVNRLPDDAFIPGQTSHTRQEWKLWIGRWRKLHPEIFQAQITTNLEN